MAFIAYLSWNCSLLLLCISIWETLYDYNNQQPIWDFSYFNKHLIEKLFSRFLQSSFIEFYLFCKELTVTFKFFILQNNLWWILFSTFHLNVTRTSFMIITIKQYLLLSGFLCFAPAPFLCDFRRIFRVLSFSNK